MAHAGKAYIHFNGETVTCETKQDPTYSSDKRTDHKIKYENKWYRIYRERCGQFYIRISGTFEHVTFSYQHL